MICRVPPPRLIDTRTRSKPMPTMVGATMSSIRRSKFGHVRAVSRRFGPAGLSTNEKSGFSAHSFSLVRPCEPDEDGADIGALLRLARLSSPCILNDARKPPAPLGSPEKIPDMRKKNNASLPRLVGGLLRFHHCPLRVGVRLLWAHPISGGPAQGPWLVARPTISSAITFYYVAGAFLVMQVGDVILKRGARLVVLVGVGPDGAGRARPHRDRPSPGSSISPSR